RTLAARSRANDEVARASIEPIRSSPRETNSALRRPIVSDQREITIPRTEAAKKKALWTFEISAMLTPREAAICGRAGDRRLALSWNASTVSTSALISRIARAPRSVGAAGVVSTSRVTGGDEPKRNSLVLRPVVIQAGMTGESDMCGRVRPLRP